MIASKVTPPVEEEGVEVEGAEEVGGATVLNCLEHSCASLCLTVAVSMAPITWKWSEKGKGTCDSRREDELFMGCRIPKHIYDGKNKIRGKIYSKML